MTRQDEQMIDQIDDLRKSSLQSSYESRMSESLEEKLKRSDSDIKEGRVYSQEEVEKRFENRFF